MGSDGDGGLRKTKRVKVETKEGNGKKSIKSEEEEFLWEGERKGGLVFEWVCVCRSHSHMLAGFSLPFCFLLFYAFFLFLVYLFRCSQAPKTGKMCVIFSEQGAQRE